MSTLAPLMFLYSLTPALIIFFSDNPKDYAIAGFIYMLGAFLFYILSYPSHKEVQKILRFMFR